jgi:hypothetical protein
VPANSSIGSFAYDPTNPSVVYAGVAFTGGYPVTYPPAGVIRSTDGGQTWASFNRGLENTGVSSLAALNVAVDPTGERVYAGTVAGVYAWEWSAATFLTISAAVPPSAPAGGSAPVAIVGQGFTSGATVRVDGQPAADVVFVDETHMTATLPPGDPGQVSSVTVENPDSQFDTLLQAFLHDFLDVPASNLFHDGIVALALHQITQGCGAGSFCPDTPISRAQVAVWIEKALHGPDFIYPSPGGVFRDVDRCSPAAKYIYQFLDDGLTNGCAPALFCPSSPVSRAQMSVFLLLAEHGPAYVPPPATGAVFGDVHQGDFAADFIEQLAAEGITAGCGGGNFCPSSPVTRGQAAAMLAKTLSLE